MTSFRFNFSGKEDPDETSAEIIGSTQWVESEEILSEKVLQNLDDEKIRAKMFVCGEVEIGHVIVNAALSDIKKKSANGSTNKVELADEAHSDLVAGEYEGGLKIWECTYDLIEFLEEHVEIHFKDKTVLDLGCGAGILGIYAFLKGARVTFQDYNKEVLEFITIPNVLINIEEERENEIKKCGFHSGDWQSFNDKLPKTDLYDIILTSETIYNESNYYKLINLFIERLKPDGVVYVAAKTYYFGVGGGLRQFEKAIQENGLLNCEICWKSTDGIRREILRITCNKP